MDRIPGENERNGRGRPGQRARHGAPDPSAAGQRGSALVRLLVVFACAAGGFLAGSGALKDDTEHLARIAELEQQLRGAELRLDLLRHRERVAILDQVDQGPSETRPGGERTAFRFREVGPDGAPLGQAQRFQVEGDLVYLDAQVIKFDDDFVEQRDLERGSSILLFRRVFGEHQAPVDGFPIDAVGARPMAYPGAEGPSDFHEELWADFWRYANDPEVARRSGVRAMHGEAPSIQLVPGNTYQVELRSAGGLSIRVVDPAPEPPADE